MSDGTPIDIGASWIHGMTGNPISMMSQRAGMKMGPMDEIGGPTNFNVYCDTDGKVYDDRIEVINNTHIQFVPLLNCNN